MQLQCTGNTEDVAQSDVDRRLPEHPIGSRVDVDNGRPEPQELQRKQEQVPEGNGDRKEHPSHTGIPQHGVAKIVVHPSLRGTPDIVWPELELLRKPR